MDSRYHFITEIELDVAPDRVWETLADSVGWTSWWRWLERVEVIEEGDDDGMGRRVRHRVVTPFRYRLGYEGVVTRAVRPTLLEMKARGDLVGSAQFRLSPTDTDGSEISFHWLVSPAKWWMRLLDPLARPVFVWSHHVLMNNFAHGLARATGSGRVEVSNRALRLADHGFLDPR